MGPNASGYGYNTLSGSKFLAILSGISAHSNKLHQIILHMYVSVDGSSYANVAANVLTGSHHIDN